MKYTNFYTIKELNYKEIEANLINENLSSELRAAIKTLIADHKAIIECKKALIKEQMDHAGALFTLFTEPISQESSKNNSSENEQNNLPQILPINSEEETKNPSEPNNKGKLKKGKKKLPLGNIIHHSLTEEDKSCPSCGHKMHKQRSITKTHVLSLPMLSTETNVFESCRCLSCGVQQTAQGLQDLKNQCIGRYHFSAVSSLAALRYQYGMASYRIEQMSDVTKIKISDSTQWFVFEEAASQIRSFITFLEKKVANAPVQHVDDTHNVVLSLVKDIESEQEHARLQGKNPKDVRSGIHTTNLTGVFPEGQLVLYKTGLHHSGEILAKILSARTLDEQVIIMADASSSNTSELNLNENEKIKIANCNSHAVRKFKELANSEEDIAKKYFIKDYITSEPLNYFLSRYKIIFENDQKTKNFIPLKRLLFHKEHSLPLMLEMKLKAHNTILKKEFEPNSDMGAVYKYFLNHFPKLCAFCHIENAPVCNNLSERMLKSIIRHRKNSLFFKTQIGACVADILTSILFTAKANDINSVDYLRDMLTYKSLWKKNPDDWLPWNYLNTVNKIKTIHSL
jgi:hypothetical protein